MKIISVELTGGLGNQLFQIFTALSISLDRELKLQILELGESPSCTKRYTYWNTLLIKMKKDGYLTTDEKIIRRLQPLYRIENIPRNKSDFIIRGGLQNYHVFHHNLEKIREKTGIDDTRVEYNFSEDKTYVSLHFRIGDYKNYSHIHPILSISYYANSINYICERDDTEKEILIFGESEDELIINTNIDYLKSIFPQISFVNIMDKHFKDYEEMILMSKCKYNIIANSTFSWWGAYLNKHKEQIVCYPNIWINVFHDLKCPSEWKMINN
jgi:hypothetical protein